MSKENGNNFYERIDNYYTKSLPPAMLRENPPSDFVVNKFVSLSSSFFHIAHIVSMYYGRIPHWAWDCLLFLLIPRQSYAPRAKYIWKKETLKEDPIDEGLKRLFVTTKVEDIRGILENKNIDLNKTFGVQKNVNSKIHRKKTKVSF